MGRSVGLRVGICDGGCEAILSNMFMRVPFNVLLIRLEKWWMIFPCCSGLRCGTAIKIGGFGLIVGTADNEGYRVTLK